MANKVTSKPTGLKITRDGRKFTFSWKRKEDYTSQTLQYCVATKFNKKGKPVYPTKTVKKKKTTKWKNKKITAKATSTTITVPEKGCAAVKFRIKAKASGKTSSSFSDKNVSKEYIVKVPYSPVIVMTVVNDYTSSFTWKTKTDKTARHFVKNQCQTIVTVDKNTSDGSKIKTGWAKIGKNGTSGSEKTWTKEEVGWDVKTASRSRWVRIRSIGWKGLMSPWIYSRRIYAVPNPAINVSATRSDFAGSGYSIAVSWTNPESPDRPIDEVYIEHAKVKPIVTVVMPSEASGTVEMSMECPSSDVSWNKVSDAGGKDGNRQAAFVDYDSIPADNCQYLTIVNKHDNHEVRSTPVLVKGGVGMIASPSIPLAEPDFSNPRKFEVTVSDRKTELNASAVAIYFRTSSAQDDFKCIGVIPPGNTNSIVCIIPEFPDGDTVSFGAQTFVGNYTPKVATDEDNETIFNISNPLMSSEIVWGEGVPLPPSVTAEAVNETSIRVSWNQSWLDATRAELSWSEDENAWESTNEPSTYIVNAAKAGHWIIAGLGIGTWYVRVRLMKGTGDEVTYSAYGIPNPPTVKLSASPDTPSLLVSPGVISKNGFVTCYWAYVSGDGTAQRQAKIYEAFPEYEPVINPTGNPYENTYYELINEAKYVRSLDTDVVPGKTYYQTTGNITYSEDPIASTDSAQHIVINAKTDSYEWLPGETHHLVVQVMSMSGELSAGYSAPMPVTIAEELSLNIVDSSLKYVNIPTEFDEYGEAIDFRTAFSMDSFPLRFKVDGFNTNNKLTCIIERAESYHVDRPDDSDYDGFEGETVFMDDYTDEDLVDSTFEIYQQDLIGYLDDGASYRVTIILEDAYGQNVTATRIPTGGYTEVIFEEGLFQVVEEPTGNPSESKYYELVSDTYILSSDTEVVEGKTYYVKANTVNPADSMYYVLVDNDYILTTDTEVMPGVTYYTKDFEDSFEIHWEHQAVMPSAIIGIDPEVNVSFITPLKPETGFGEGDVIDIYRLSADPPVLIYADAVMADDPITYVDPYPALGKFGGYRIVYRTYNGDYITEQNQLAMVDYEADDNPEYRHDTFGIIIDFDDEQIVLPGNVSFSNKWSKDFTLTKYLGGSVQGDWNQAVERTMSANTTIPVEVDGDNLKAIRRLAVYPGICHIRTTDGSSFAANINVNDDREEKWTTSISKVSLDITKCDPEGQDGMTYEDWMNDQES